MLLHWDFADWSSVNTLFEILVKIGIQCPKDIGNPIKEKHIQMLVAMQWLVRLRIAMAQYRRFCNIIVHTINVRVGMVHNVMFDFPDKRVCTQCIHG
ncbi:MAG: hypothetical protein RLZZ543_2218 [Bacteroidota bacterium]